MNRGLVSIIIPYYRKKKYFKKTLFSAYNQTYRKKEIIIVYDDNSKKDLNFIKSLIYRKKNIKLIINKENIGVGLSRNKAIKKSKGEFLAFLDADDIWKENKLIEQIKFMNKNNIDASFTSYEVIDEQGKKISFRNSNKLLTFNNLIYSCDIGLSTVILRKNKFSKDIVFPPIKTKEDYVLWLRLSRKGTKFFGIFKKLSLWRKTNNSLSSSTIRKLIDGYKVYNFYLKFGMLKSLFHLFILSLNFLRKK